MRHLLIAGLLLIFNSQQTLADCKNIYPNRYTDKVILENIDNLVVNTMVVDEGFEAVPQHADIEIILRQTGKHLQSLVPKNSSIKITQPISNKDYTGNKEKTAFLTYTLWLRKKDDSNFSGTLGAITLRFNKGPVHSPDYKKGIIFNDEAYPFIISDDVNLLNKRITDGLVALTMPLIYNMACVNEKICTPPPPCENILSLEKIKPLRTFKRSNLSDAPKIHE